MRHILALAMLIGAPLLASPVYEVRVIPLPAGFAIGQGYAINSAGVVAGGVALFSDTRGFVGTPDGSQVFPMPSISNAYGINDSGVVAGSTVGSGLSNGFTATTVATIINNPLAGFPSPGPRPSTTQAYLLEALPG